MNGFDLIAKVEDATTEESLHAVDVLTSMIRQHQSAIVRLGKERRRFIRRLREQNVPYREISSRMGVSEQALFADLRKHPIGEDE